MKIVKEKHRNTNLCKLKLLSSKLTAIYMVICRNNRLEARKTLQNNVKSWITIMLFVALEDLGLYGAILSHYHH